MHEHPDTLTIVGCSKATTYATEYEPQCAHAVFLRSKPSDASQGPFAPHFRDRPRQTGRGSLPRHRIRGRDQRDGSTDSSREAQMHRHVPRASRRSRTESVPPLTGTSSPRSDVMSRTRGEQSLNGKYCVSRRRHHMCVLCSRGRSSFSRLFSSRHAAVRSTQVVMHHFAQPERQVRHAVHCRDHFEDGQLRDRRQRVRCQ